MRSDEDSSHRGEPVASITGDESSKPLMVMAVGNAVSGDSRVEKSAVTAQAAGYSVIVVGVKHKTVHQLGSYQGIPILRPTPDWRAYNEWRKDADLRTDETEEGFERLLRDIDVQADTAKHEMRRLAVAVGEAPKLIAPMKARRLATPPVSWANPLIDTYSRLRKGLVRPRGNWKSRRLWFESLKPQAWRKIWPQIEGFEALFLEAFANLSPDVIHVHDRHPMSAAALYVDTQRANGREVGWVYDAHEYLPGQRFSGSVRHRIGWLAMEREMIRHADAVVTVSDELSQTLKTRHELDTAPVVVTNAPVLHNTINNDLRRQSVRAEIGLSEGEPLLVYVGKLAERRGIYTVVDALASLPGVHVVFVASADPGPREELRRRAEAIGSSDRLHIVDYVPSENVTSYISSATAGLSPLFGSPAHHAALPTKIREYIQARLPIIGTNLKVQGEFICANRVGAVHAEGDAAGLGRAANHVLENLTAFRGAITDELRHRHSWESQEAALQLAWSRAKTTARPVKSSVTVRQPDVLPPLSARLETLLAATSIYNYGSLLHRDNVYYYKEPNEKLWHKISFPESDMRSQLKAWARIATPQSVLFLENFEGELAPPGLLSPDHAAQALKAAGVRVVYDCVPGILEDPGDVMAREPNSYWRDLPSQAVQRTTIRRRRLRSLLDQWGIVATSSQPGINLGGSSRYWIPELVDYESFASADHWLSRFDNLGWANPLVGILADERSAAEDGAISDAIRNTGLRSIKVVNDDDLKNIDIAIGSLTRGWYSNNLLGALALGIPIISNIDELAKCGSYSELPIMNADTNTVSKVLGAVASSPVLVRRLSVNGRKYVRDFHSFDAIVRGLGSVIRHDS